MCDGMRIDRRLVLIGVMLIVLSMTMATQYAIIRTSYSYSLVHPSNADIRFIASDNSTDGIFLLRINGTNGTTNSELTLSFGNISANQNKTYTAAFGIVNEESVAVNITHINVSADGGTDYLQVSFHGDRDTICSLDASSILVWDKGSTDYTASHTVWKLAAGDNDRTTLDGSTGWTKWNNRAGVQYSLYDVNAVNGTDDYVWVQISIVPPDNANTAVWYNGQIWIHTKAFSDVE